MSLIEFWAGGWNLEVIPNLTIHDKITYNNKIHIRQRAIIELDCQNKGSVVSDLCKQFLGNVGSIVVTIRTKIQESISLCIASSRICATPNRHTVWLWGYWRHQRNKLALTESRSIL